MLARGGIGVVIGLAAGEEAASAGCSEKTFENTYHDLLLHAHAVCERLRPGCSAPSPPLGLGGSTEESIRGYCPPFTKVLTH
jgi:hypothetical protein